ncbi:FCD domain-containing protein [Paracoccus sp. S3-43]|uniref:FCD domain-containing protein n=1 Tax=Paracoccus sp. S3-43 TaxID=3030011 RepID=UPI0023B14649|nr:FCD domain-containing protein [Paracoccus sp. S3-43]WEF24693.1 FCD domain-containing protein [Paracoccus sp. S3-43]
MVYLLYQLKGGRNDRFPVAWRLLPIPEVSILQMLNGEPIQRRRLYQDVADRLSKAIIEGDIKAGEPLPSEREIMDAFGVGRTAVREALFALQTDGLVSLSSGRRPVVVEQAKSIMEKLATPARQMLIKPDRLRQLQEARRLLEKSLARQAARTASSEQITAIEAALAKNRAALGDRDAFVRTNMEFHVQIARACDNVFVDALLTAVSEWLDEHRRIAIKKPGAAELAYRRHEEIFQAIRCGEMDAAETAMEQHLIESQDAYWAEVGHGSGSDAQPRE